ncbi:uncharacterized protein LOC135837462 [Planococcus citri]|uniref:uncharacterized protein LOC135837462 n=1 Tax=Planococcus citri TaxID=170843 RepID=UPI0031F8295E
MDGDNRTISNEEEVYAMSSGGNIIYNEIITPGRPVMPINNSVFRTEWQNFPEFQSWLRPIPDDKTKAWCQACEKMFKADLKSLRVHGVGRSHLKMVKMKFPEASETLPAPAAVYNVITDRKGTYGLGILSKTDSNPTAGSTLYVNPTNPNTNVLTCDPKQDKDNFVIVSMPKSDIEELESQQEQIPVQFHAQIQKKSSQEVNDNNKIHIVDKNNSNKDSKSCDSFPEDLIETEDLEDDDEEEDEEDEDDDDSMYEFESKMAKAKCSLDRKRIGVRRNVYHHSYSSLTPEMAMVTKPAPFWRAKAIVNGHVSELKLSDYLGRYLVLFFYPQDFSKLCPNEILELSDRISEFRNINTEVVACSVDSYLTHQVWCKMSRADGGVAYPKIPLLSDYTHDISKSYGCYLPQAGHTVRAHYIIDTKGILRHLMMNDIQVARDVNEILKLVQAFQRADEEDKNSSHEIIDIT